MDCPICFDPITDQNGTTTTCGHRFHKTCLDGWLEAHKTCPMCRKNWLSPIFEAPRPATPSAPLRVRSNQVAPAPPTQPDRGRFIEYLWHGYYVSELTPFQVYMLDHLDNPFCSYWVTLIVPERPEYRSERGGNAFCRWLDARPNNDLCYYINKFTPNFLLGL